MPTITTRFGTKDASKLLQQLSKHFAHKVPADWDTEKAEISFDPGKCHMVAKPENLEISVTAANEDDLQKLIFVFEVHLVRFAWREDVILNWSNADETPVIKSARVEEGLAAEREKYMSKRRQ